MSGPRKLDLPEILEFHEVKDAFTRAVMILMALTTLAGGVVEFLHSRAAVEGEHAGIQAHEFGVRAMAELVRDDQAAQTEYEKFALATEERTRRSNALQQRFLPLHDALPADPGRADEAARLAALIKGTEELSEITPDSQYAPSHDPAFPDRFFASKRGPYWAVWARQDAANAEFTAWKKQQSQYTTVLTLYAAALYLFGLALALQLPVRRSLVYVAVSLLLVGSVAAGWSLATRPERMSEADAEQYAAAYAGGKTTYAAAHDRRGYEDAARYFTEAVARRKRFAQAFQDRAEAFFNAGSPQRMGLPGVTESDSLQAAARDQAEALRQGLVTSDLLLSHGNNLFLLGIDGPAAASRPQLRASIAETRRAIALDPGYPLLYYNLAETYLAAGAFDRARQTYGQAVRLTLGRDGHGYRFTRVRQQLFVSGALTDLESIFRNRGKLAPGAANRLQCEIATAKAFVVGSVSMDAVQPMPPEGGCPPEPRATATGGAWSVGLWWRAALPSFARGRDILSAQWYYQDPVPQKWVALPDVSVLATSSPRQAEDDPGVFERQEIYLTATSPPSCVPHGRFRVDLYVNGRPAAVSPPFETPASFSAMQAVLRRDLNAAFCVPESWKAQRAGSGFIAEYRDGAGARGGRGRVLVRFHYPRPWATTPAAKSQVARRYLGQTLARVLHMVPGTYEELAQPPKGYTHLDFMPETAYSDGDTEVMAQSGVDDDGAIIISLVYGPKAYIDADAQARETFTTLVFGEKGPDY